VKEMADFNSHIITNAGRNLLARALAGEGKVLFTKAAFGDQKHSGNLREVTELKNKKLGGFYESIICMFTRNV